MTVRPILFSAAMVLALLEGRKTQTRRVLKLPNANAEERRGPWEASTVGGPGCFTSKREPFAERPCLWHPKAGTTVVPPYAPGDLLWVRETWADASPHGIRYAATDDIHELRRKRSPLHMPRAASRLTLEVTGVKVERLQNICEEDAKAEGLKPITKDGGRTIKWGIPDRDGLPGSDDLGWNWSQWCVDPRDAFFTLWDKINGDSAHVANPWVVAITFKVHKANVDALIKAREAA